MDKVIDVIDIPMLWFAFDPINHRIFSTGRDKDFVYILDESTNKI
jgi:hypothetical protein